MRQGQIMKYFPTLPDYCNGTAPFNKVKDNILTNNLENAQQLITYFQK